MMATGLDLRLRWTPEELAARGDRYCRAAEEAMAPTPDVPLSRWAESTIVLPPTVTSSAGPLSFARTPYVRALLDAFADPEVERLTFAKSTQVAGTTLEIAMIASAAGFDPGPVLSVQPNDEMARAFSLERVIPVFKASAPLERLLPRGRGLNARQMVLDTATINFASARSSADLASRPVRFLILGETDEYPPSTGQKGSPIAQGEERTRTFWNRKIYENSTPVLKQGYIWQELLRSNQHRYYVPCPHCGAFQVLFFSGSAEPDVPGPAGRLTWPKDEKGHPTHTPDEIEQGHLAVYICGACTAVWEDRDKEAIIARGEWRPIVKGLPRRHLGFHIWAAYSPWLSFSAIAAKHLRDRNDPARVKVFVNKWLARPYEEAGARPSIDVVMDRRRTYKRGTVPMAVRFLTAAVDVHDAFQYWAVWGWGVAFTGWCIDAGREDTAMNQAAGWQRVFEAVTRLYPRCATPGDAEASAPSALDAIAVGQPAGLVLMDAGWDKPADANEVVDEWRVLSLCDAWNYRLAGPLFQPSKGGSRPGQIPPLEWNRTYDRDREGKPLKGRLQLHIFNPWFFKKQFYSRLARTGEVGGFWLPEDLPQVVMNQFLGEEMITHPDGTEEWRRTGENHALDVSVMCLAAAWKYRIFLEAPPPERPREPKPEPSQGAGLKAPPIRTKY